MRPVKRAGIIALWIFFIFFILYFPSWHILPKEEKTINIFAWGDILDPAVLSQFEQETGIRVHLSYYASNEELQVKMAATRGLGYDLIIPSDYVVSKLIDEELLLSLDKSKLDFLDDLNPALLNHPFDPGNKYSLPLEWEIYGLGVDRDFFENRPFTPSWSALFDPGVVDYKIALNNDPIEVLQFAHFYLTGETDAITKKQFEEVRQLLLMQRQWIVAYSDFRADYFIATGNAPIALTVSSRIKRIRPVFPSVDFVLPKEGTFVSIENCCIPKASQRADLVYQFLNHLYRKESMIIHYNNLWLYPATLSPIPHLELADFEERLLMLTRSDFESLYFFRNLVPQSELRNLWVEVKSL